MLSPDTLAREIEAELKGKFPVQGLLITARSGPKWNDTIENYYLISNGKKGSFIVRQHYFMEASEGHGARFYHMLKEFRVVSP